MCTKDYIKDIIRCVFGIIMGFIVCKYTQLSFGFLTPVLIFGTVFTNYKFSLKVYIKNNWWIFGFGVFGLFISEIFSNNILALSIVTYAFFFTSLFFIHKNQSGVRMGILGYTCLTIYYTYSSLPVENMIKDLFFVIVLGGVISFILLTIFPNSRPSNTSLKKEREDIHKNIENTLLVTTIVFLVWILYMIFNIRETFFAYATLCGVYGSLDLEIINKESFPSIYANILGCSVAILFSFILNGIGRNFFIFTLGLMVLFFPMLYNVYYSSNIKVIKFFVALIKGTIFPIGLYLTGSGDIFSKAFARGVQITVMLVVSILLIKVILYAKGESYE